MTYIELLPADTVWVRFNFFAWISVLGIVITYTVIRIHGYIHHKPFRLIPTILQCAFIPLLFLFLGNHYYLKRFYAVEWGALNSIKLHYVYPEGRYIELYRANAHYLRGRTGCTVKITTAHESFTSNLTGNKQACRDVVNTLSH